MAGVESLMRAAPREGQAWQSALRREGWRGTPADHACSAAMQAAHSTCRCAQIYNSTMPGKAVFAASPRRIAELLAPLHRVAHELWPVIDGGQTYVCYVNWSDGSFWHFSAMGHYNFPGRESLIRGSPELHEVLDCICASKFDDEVALATLYMSERASFHALLARLELLLDSSPTPRQLRNAAMSVACFGSTAAYKHKDTAGKTMAEIDADHGSVIALAQRAAAVRARAEAALGFKVKAGWARRH